MALQHRRLPQPAPARVLACGAYLKNSACLIQGDEVVWSPVHGDLADPGARESLEFSVTALLRAAGGPIAAVAHDLHPDFHSTQVAQAVAAEQGVPAVPVQHHHAHISAVQAEQGLAEPVVGLALDGVGLGTDGTVWGGEVLWVDSLQHTQHWARLGHLATLHLPGGDVAAQEPWRMAAAALYASHHAELIVPRLGPVVGEAAAGMVLQMLDKHLNSPATSSAGRWFDAVAGLLGLSVRQSVEAEAAVALERAATAWLAVHPGIHPAWPSRDLKPLVVELLALCPPGATGEALQDAQGRGAAMFHHALAGGLVHAAVAGAREHGTHTVVLGGGCFYNQLLSRLVTEQLSAAGLQVQRPQTLSCGDAGLALGQAWVAACKMANNANHNATT
jgi:hydrogenase maturation protein HypF